MLATVPSATLLGVDGIPVTVEVHVGQGLPAFTVVGLPDTSCREARDRVRAALLTSDFTWPDRRTTVNLAPTSVRKMGSALDLAIAIGVLVASEQMHHRGGGGAGLRRRSSVSTARSATCPVCSPLADAVEASEVVVARPLGLRGRAGRAVAGPFRPRPAFARGGPEGRRALAPSPRRSGSAAGPTTARPGRRAGPPSGPHRSRGRRRRGPPPLDGRSPGGGQDDARPTPPRPAARPRRRPRPRGHPGPLRRRPPPSGRAGPASAPAGASPRVERGRHGRRRQRATAAGRDLPGPRRRAVPRRAGRVLRRRPRLAAPATGGGLIRIARAETRVTVPARFLLVGAMNPCPCGEGMTPAACRCTDRSLERYRRRLSGPLLDRFDLRLDVHRPDPHHLLHGAPADSSSVVAARVRAARARAAGRGVRANAEHRRPGP